MYFDKNTVSKKSVNIFLSMCLTISHMIKKFDFTPE